MRLQSLHIKGFKSFANDTTIHFNEDVIGVVGPNGSGKSNVVDAIRWVLGEQKSKDLRLEQMTDVIFNGTKKRKEAASATVELTFVNDKGILPTEYSQVSIARTLYRSGESEYNLNNVTCRLKDIKSLLVDTGIGSNSYAIIALGMVDDILEDKDDSRRRMFEQAAGISKFKTRKKETIQKLKLANDDLDRVDDLLFEIELNMKNLEKQAKKTKKYFELKDEYKVLAINNAVRSIQDLKATYKNLNESILSQQGQYNQLQTEINVLEADIQKEKKNILDKELALSSKQKELGQIIANIRSAESDKSLTEQSRNYKNQNIKNVEKLIQDLEVQKLQLQKDIETLEERIKDEKEYTLELKANLEGAQLKLEELRTQYTLLKKEEDSRLQQITQLQNAVFEEEKNIAVKTNQIEGLQSDILNLKQNIDNAEKEQKDITKLFEVKNTEKNKAEIHLNNLKDKETYQKENLKELELKRDSIQNILSQTNRSLDAKQNEFDLVQSMIQSYEGFPESIKYLSQNWRKDVPILSDLLDVEEQYKPVIESYLEPYLNYFVVDDLKTASQAIQILGGAQKGKANFFLLNEVPVSKPVTIKNPEFTSAIDAIKVDHKYLPLLQYILNNTYIYKGSIDHIAGVDIDKDHILLSENGSFYKTNITISGGAVGLFEGKKIGRKKNLEKIEKLLSELHDKKVKTQQDLEVVKKEIEVLKSNDMRKLIDEASQHFTRANQEIVKINLEIENFVKNINQTQQKIDSSDKIIIEHKKQIEKYTESLQVSNNSENISTLDNISESLNKASESYNANNIEYIKQENLLSSLTKDFEYKQARLREVSQRNTLEKNKLEREKEEYFAAAEKLVILERNLSSLYKEKSGFQGELGASEQAYHQARVVITDKEEKAKSLTRQSNQLQITINQQKDKYNEVKYDITSVGDRLNIEFGVPINDVINLTPDETIPREEELDKASNLKVKIQNYGEINPLALEAYEEIKVRYDLIIQQKQDILEAQESLKQTIKEIETTAVAQFMDAFEKIRNNFITVFRHLFTEDDTCDLILLDESDPLESAIEIIAKPRGKKPKSLSQLSGGEKTLTATALLFALYLLKPAPFCIFDEVDAPLDDANIQKFNKIIKNFSANSQFIIVTHNKATMTAVDVLYGVYMQEPGVSNVTPVDFRSLKDDKRFDGLS
jgi:chromosome segregation protein